MERAHGETTLASWYGPGFDGLPTASGEPYDPYGFTAAHKTLPLGTELVVSYGGSSVGVTVNDRGPYVGARELDLSQGAAEALGLTQAGVDYVEYSYAGGSASGYGYDRYASAQQYQYAGPGANAATDRYSGAGVAAEQYEAPSVAYDQYDPSGYEATGAAYDGYEAHVPEPTEVAGDPGITGGAGYEQAASPSGGEVGGGLHVVRPGETLSGISAELGTTVDDLAVANGIADPDVIYAGQMLFY